MLGINDKVRLVDLYEQSFIGEFEVIYRQNAERSYIATNRKHHVDIFTVLYFVKANEFNAIMEEFKDFDLHVRLRAMRRRSYFRYLETEMSFEVNKHLDSCLDIKEDSNSDESMLSTNQKI